MEYNKYIQGKEFISEIFEGMSNEEILDIYNDYLTEQSIDDLLMEFAFVNYSDDLLLEVKAPDVQGAVKGIIAGMKVRNGAKKYAKAYLDYQMVEIEAAKIKHSKKWTDAEGPKKKQMEAAWDAAKEAKKAKLDAISDRIESIAKASGSTRVQNMVDPLKAKAKMQGIEQVIKLAKQLYSDSEYIKMEHTYKNIKAAAQTAEEKLAAIKKEEGEIKNNAEVKAELKAAVKKSSVETTVDNDTTDDTVESKIKNQKTAIANIRKRINDSVKKQTEIDKEIDKDRKNKDTSDAAKERAKTRAEISSKISKIQKELKAEEDELKKMEDEAKK